MNKIEEIKSEPLDIHDIKIDKDDRPICSEYLTFENEIKEEEMDFKEEDYSLGEKDNSDKSVDHCSNAEKRKRFRARIIALRESGRGISNIARELGVCRQTVAKWTKRWEEEQNLCDRSRPGQPRKTTAEEDHQILTAVGKKKCTYSYQIVEHLQLNISPSTVRRRLRKQEGITCRAADAKMKLTEDDLNIRLNFANYYKDKDMDFWARVIFTAEKTFCSHGHGKIYCWCRSSTRFACENVCEKARWGHETCNLWGWIHLHGVGELTEILGRFTPDQYIEILDEVMLPSVRTIAMPYPEKIMFMHDGCPVHTSRIVRSWFQEHPEIELLSSPEQGRDLNPIENVWETMMREWKQPDAMNSEVLKQHSFKVWESLRRKQEVIANYVRSVPYRLQMVIDQEGGWTDS